MADETALIIPDEGKLQTDIEAINKFQIIVHQNLIEGQDYGVIPGTKKPTLLKPGAEKITKLLGLCDLYEIIDRQEDWGKPFFRYLVKCQLVPVTNTAVVVSEGFGECNSMESRYRYRWLWPSELPKDFIKDGAVKRINRDKSVQYRVDNEEIYSQVNTIIKMAKKRALVDAALSAGRLSQVFTQDIEDIGVPDRDAKKEEAKDAPPPTESKNNIDMLWLKQTLEEMNWADVGVYLHKKYEVSGQSVKEMVMKLNKKQAGEFVMEVQRRMDAGKQQPIATLGECPNCGNPVETQNEEDSVCSACGANLRWQGSTPYLIPQEENAVSPEVESQEEQTELFD